jgi:hypothetical protein
MEMKKQVLSFNEFVNEAYKIITEAEGSEGSIDALKKLLGGGLGFTSTDQAQFVRVIDRIDSLGVSSVYAEEAKDFAQTITDFLNSKESGIVIKQKGMTSDAKTLNVKFGWLVNGTVRVKGNPSLADDGSLASTHGTDDDSSTPYPLADIIRGLFAYNLYVLSNQTGSGTKILKQESNYGIKAKNKKDAVKYLTIDEASLETDLIQIIPYVEETVGVSPVGEYGFAFPIYTIGAISKGAGKELSKDMYTEVIPPNPSESIEEVTDLAYNSSAMDFFEENKVVIGEEGKASLNAILSEFHSISKIVVNGGASSKPTSRAGGNEALAKDRMKAGVAMLNQLKKGGKDGKDGVAQLKDANIVEGKAVVQSAAATESDPKMQQVSFVISGSIRKIENKGEAKEITIQRVDLKKADRVSFKKSIIYCSYNA